MTATCRQLAGCVVLVLVATVAPAGVGRADFREQADRVVPARPFDLDGDGSGDLATGVPFATVQGTYGAGAVGILYGSTSGVTARDGARLTQTTQGVPGDSEHIDQFGSAVASGDFDADGYADLAVGAIGEDRTDGFAAGSGAVSVLPGGPQGVSGAGTRVFRPADAGSEHIWGGGLAVGDLDGDGYADLVVSMGSHDDDAGGGGVSVLYGSAHGLGTARATTLDNASTYQEPDIWSNRFGSSFAVEDITGDGIDDLAVASHRGEVGHQVGGVAVFHGRSGGVATAPDETVDATAPGLASPGWDYSPQFASSVALGDFDADGHADLVLTDGGATTPDSPGCNEVAGCTGGLVVLPGTGGGLDASGRTFLTQRSDGIPAGPGSRLGIAGRLYPGDVDADGADDLVVGLGGANVGSAESAGAVLVLRGGGGGLSGAGARRWTQSSFGVPGVSEDDDSFGAGARVVDLGRTGAPDLVVQAAGETVGGHARAGAVTVLYGRAQTGPVIEGAQLWTEDSPGVRGTAGLYHGFGTLER